MKIGDLSPAGHYSISSVAVFDLTCWKSEAETLKNPTLPGALLHTPHVSDRVEPETTV